MAGRKQFSDIKLASGETLLEAITRLREDAAREGVFVIALGFDVDSNLFVGGHVPLTDEKLTKLLFDFISWINRKEASEEKLEPIAPTDPRFS